MGMQVARWLRSRGKVQDEAIALVSYSSGVELSYGALDARACAIAGGFVSRGLEQGARIGLLGGNSLDFVTTFFGALYAGLVVVPLPIASSPLEIKQKLAQVGARLLVHDEARASLAEQAAPTCEIAVAGSIEGAPILGPIDLPIDADAMLLFTSGTTASAKAARISHASLVAHTSALVHHALRLERTDTVLGVLPLTHSYGARLALFAPLFAGARTLLVERFEVNTVARALSSTTFFPGVPTMFAALGELERIDAPRLRFCLSAGAPLAKAVRIRAEAALGCSVREGYGLTEATFSTLDTPDDEGGIGTVGRAVPGVEIRLVEGEVQVRGQNLMTAYLDDEEATAAAFDEGWLRTGDLGEIDDEGRLRIVDRRKDLIVRGGFNVVPAEVEAALVAHPAIADALVVGVPDARFGEEIVAVVVERAPIDVASLLEHLRERLATTKLPRALAKVDSLPSGASGKALRRVVRDRLVKGDLVASPLRPG